MQPRLLWPVLRAGGGVVAFTLQQFVMPVVLTIIMFAALANVPSVPVDLMRARIIWQVVVVARWFAAAVLVGSAGGWLVWEHVPSARSTGRWLWILPLVLLAWEFARESSLFSTQQAAQALFFPGPEGDGWWGVGFLTSPSICIVCYSVSMQWHNRRNLKSSRPV